MATTTIPPLTPTVGSKPHLKRHDGGTQKRLFRSISRFLSVGKSRSKLPTAERSQVVGPGGEVSQTGVVGAGGTDTVPLRDVRSNVSTRSGRAASASTDDSRSLGDELDRLGAGLRNGSRSGGGDGDGDGASRLSGADTDASIRPISPASLAPSSIASRANTVATSVSGAGSYIPTHTSLRSYASTKPTTLPSIDSGGGGANRIAVVPGTGGGPGTSALPPSVSGGSLAPPNASGAMTFSSLPTTTTTSSSPPSPRAALSPAQRLSTSSSSAIPNSQVPRHTLAHPRNNPHPASPPPDNASMLTLASSSFAPSFVLARTPGLGGTSISGLRARAGTGGREREADEDASVRALAGSRRASDESLGSRSTWSAAVLGGTGGKGDGGSVRTVGTEGTGGELLGGGMGETERDEVGEGETETEGESEGQGQGERETEAQKVVRREGEEGGAREKKDDRLDADDGTDTRRASTTVPLVEETATSTTPTRTPADTEAHSISPSASPSHPSAGSALASHALLNSTPIKSTQAPHSDDDATPTAPVPTATTTSYSPSDSSPLAAHGPVTPTRSVFDAGGYETDADAQSFVDARSTAGDSVAWE